jgi:hypothetical protein
MPSTQRMGFCTGILIKQPALHTGNIVYVKKNPLRRLLYI